MSACSNSIDGSASEILLVSNLWLIAGTAIRRPKLCLSTAVRGSDC